MEKGRALILGLNVARLALRPCGTQRGVTTHLLKEELVCKLPTETPMVALPGSY